MDSFEFNKIVGALLGTVFVLFSISIISDAIFAAHSPTTPGYFIEAEEVEEAAAGGGESPAAPEAIEPTLASADVGAGEAVFKRCAACHTTEEGGANKVGPNLWDIVGRPMASEEGFSYSAAMREFAEGGSVVWDYEHLNGFLLAPKSYVKGTAMSFAGLKKLDDRADLIAYLRTLSADPAPLPEEGATPEAQPAAAGAGRDAQASEEAPDAAPAVEDASDPASENASEEDAAPAQ
jgi:cytochrome c